MNKHIDCMDGRLKIIKEVLPIINREELTKTQKTALQMSKQLLNVFYENKGNYETVLNLYNELIAEFPTWVIPE